MGVVCNKVLESLVKTDFTYMIRTFLIGFDHIVMTVTILDFLIVFYSKTIPEHNVFVFQSK